MSEIIDITDREPNPALIEALERHLEWARAGEIRSAVLVAAWADNATATSWALDGRTYQKMVYAELTLAQNELAMNLSLKCDGILAMALRGET